MGKRELIVDSFAGGGGASLGIAWALGRGPDIAINHDEQALAMHEANHPSTLHVREDVWKTDLRSLTKGKKVGLIWLSPDCKHFSRAKGSVPVNKEIRSLAWVAVRWASQIRPRVMILENVREFADWGPLTPQWMCDCGWKGSEGQAVLQRSKRRCPRCESAKLVQTQELMPDPDKKGMTFRLFVNRLRGHGYNVQWRNLNAADFGAPTHRRRLFLIARCDGKPIVWPEPTHCAPDKVDDTPLFTPMTPWRTAAECIDWTIPCPSIFERARPLKEATMRRIAMGIKRYVLEAEKPFVVNMAHGGKVEGIDYPLSTIATEKGGCRAAVMPILSKYHGQKANESRCKEVGEPFNTLDTQPRYGLVAPTLAKFKFDSDGQRIDEPMPTVTANSFVKRPGGAAPIGLVSAFIAKHFGGVVGVPIETPLPTTLTSGCQNQIVAANLIHLNHGAKQWSGTDEPLRTITSSGQHAALVYSFLIRYFGTAIGQHVTEPLYTITGKDRFGLVTIKINGESYVIVDIGMRMLTPRELARAQGFPDTYELTGTKTSQVARIGNSVCPVMARVLVESNYAKATKPVSA